MQLSVNNNNLTKVNKLIKNASYIIFDLDGTLMNSEHFHREAFNSTVLELTKIDDAFNNWDKFFGKSDKEIYSILLQDKIKLNVSLNEFLDIKEKKLSKIMSSKDLSSFLTSGILNFLNKQKETRKPMSVVSASEQLFVDEALKYTNLENYFEFRYGTKHTFFSKPSSSPYLNVLRKKRLKSKDVVIFEDSNSGIKSALEAGCSVVRILENIESKSTLEEEGAFIKIQNFLELN
jgi:beta-phosphoglucomutase